MNFEQFVDKFSLVEYIGAIVFLLGIIYKLYEKVSKRIDENTSLVIKNHLSTNTDVKANIQAIEAKIRNSPLPSLYRLLLRDVLSFLDRQLGELKPFSYKAFDKHLIWSLIYSFLFFYISWLLGGDGKVGTYQLIPVIDKVGLSFFIIAEILILYYSIKYTSKLYQKSTKPFQKVVIMLVLSALLVLVIGVFAVKIKIDIMFVIFISVGLAYISLGGIEILKALIVLVIISFISKETISSQSILLILFLVILPLINSIFDYISMYFSRLFAQNILQTNSKFRVFLDVILDIVVAVVLLFSLASVLYHIIDLVNVYRIKQEGLLIPIDMYKEQLFKNPFDKDVLWITMMFFSTLIPTLLHIFLAIFSYMAMFITKPHLHTLSDKLKEFDTKDIENQAYLEKEKIAKDLVVHYYLTNHIWWHLFMRLVLRGMLVVVSLLFLYKIYLQSIKP